MTTVPNVQENARVPSLGDTIDQLDAGSRLALYDFLRADRLPQTRLLSNLCRAGLLKFTPTGYEAAAGVREAVMAAQHKRAVQSGAIDA